MAPIISKGDFCPFSLCNYVVCIIYVVMYFHEINILKPKVNFTYMYILCPATKSGGL